MKEFELREKFSKLKGHSFKFRLYTQNFEKHRILNVHAVV